MNVRLLLPAAALTCAMGLSRCAEAQTTARTPTTSPLGASPMMMANPYTNPYANPYLNPYAATLSTSPTNAALFFFAAQQTNGGIGSGQLSGTRPARGAATTAAQAPPAQENKTRTMDTPGAGASHYFGRSPRPGGMGPSVDRYYSRYNNYYLKNGH